MAIKFFFPENLLSPTTVLLASVFPKTYISSLKGDLFSFENNCWEACLRKGIEMFLLHFEKKFFSLGICDQLLNRISRKLGLGRQSFDGEHVFCEMWNPATVPCRCGGKEDSLVSFPAARQGEDCPRWHLLRLLLLGLLWTCRSIL